MAKKIPVGPLGVTAAIPRQPIQPTAMPQSAQAALDASKKLLDDGFAEAMASRLGSSMPCNASGGRPAYVFSEPVPMSVGAPTPTQAGPGALPPASQEPATVLDSLVRLLELSLTTVNTVLSGGAMAMDWFYGARDSDCDGSPLKSPHDHHTGSEHARKCEGDCGREKHSASPCCCQECVPGVGSCC